MSDFNRYSSVGEMLSTLQWDSLKKRRDIQSLCVLYKILNGLIDVSLPECMIKKTLLSLEVTTKDLLQYLQQLIAISTVFFHE